MYGDSDYDLRASNVRGHASFAEFPLLAYPTSLVIPSSFFVIAVASIEQFVRISRRF